MSAETIEQLPHIPEIQIIEPIVQCGVLYLGSAIPSPGRRGLDSVQEPFSHRYPVDGTNTARGIDSILSVYDNGIQLTFTRQPHVVIFFPLSSLIYCASLRFSIVENDQTSLTDWRFTTIDSTIKVQSKHPPLFCIVVQRTQILSGEECHSFVTKSDDASLALVRTISQVYANLKPNTKPLKSPIFYQLDRYGRKISETTGVIYLSPATNDESQLNQIENSYNSLSIINRNHLLDPSFNGFFYRTDANIIEQWQLWDDDDLSRSRPHPPDSPFGQHQGLYHDDLTHEMHQYLRHMNDEEHSSSCSCSSSSSSSSSSEHNRHRRSKSKTKYDTNELNKLFPSSSFNPSPSVQSNIGIKQLQQAPIIIEKVVPNPMIINSQNPSNYITEQSLNPSILTQQIDPNYIPFSDTYQINERGERITKEGNRIVFMDVIQPNLTNNNQIEPQPYRTHKSHRRRSSHIPVIDLRSIENLFHSKNSSQQRETIIDNNEKYLQNQNLSTSNMLEIVEGYFEDYKGKKLQLNAHDAQAMLGHLEQASKKEHRRSKNSNNKTHRHRRNHSTLTAGPSINYVERSSLKYPPQQALTESQQPNSNEPTSNIYGSTEQPSQSLPSTSHHEIQLSNDPNATAITDDDYISPFRYMQSSINPLLFREYRNMFTGN